MLVLDIIFGRGLETAGWSCFPHGNTLQAVKSRWKRSAWREWSALHAANPRIRGCELLTLCYELFALSRHPPSPGKCSLSAEPVLGNVSGQSAGSPSGDSSFPLLPKNQRAPWSLPLHQDTADVPGTSFSHHLWQDHGQPAEHTGGGMVFVSPQSAQLCHTSEIPIWWCCSAVCTLLSCRTGATK